MARKRKRFGDSTEVHAQRAKGTIREMKRLRKAIQSRMKSPPDCTTAVRLAVILAQQSGAYLIDRTGAGSGRAGFGGRGVSRLIDRVLRTCVVKPRSKAHERKIHAVWR